MAPSKFTRTVLTARMRRSPRTPSIDGSTEPLVGEKALRPAWLAVADFIEAGFRQEIAENPACSGGVEPSKQRVAGEAEVEIIDDVHFREFADELAAAFAMEGFDSEILCQPCQEMAEGHCVEYDFFPNGCGKGGGGVAGDEKVNVAAMLFKNWVFWVQLPPA